jgi:hypothetical protein
MAVPGSRSAEGRKNEKHVTRLKMAMRWTEWDGRRALVGPTAGKEKKIHSTKVKARSTWRGASTKLPFNFK